MTTFKKRQVVMLPTNEKAKIGDIVMSKFDDIHILTKNDGKEYTKTVTSQHLYILSDEEIKEGDWYINTWGDGQPMLCHVDSKEEAYDCNILKDCYKKIVATTDKLMLDEQSTFIYGYKAPLPQPSQSFIEYFVEEYNKGNVLDEVEVEYEEITVYKQTLNEGFGSYYRKEESEFVLKINPDNTINLKPKKDSWSREEITPLIDFLKEIAKDNLDRVSPGIKMKAMTYLAAFEKNL